MMNITTSPIFMQLPVALQAKKLNILVVDDVPFDQLPDIVNALAELIAMQST